MATVEELEARIARLEALVTYLYERTMSGLPDLDAAADPRLPDGVREALAKGDKIAAVKAYREATGADLRTAQQAIDAL
jgi:ribosomal protein L7/L12